jgi:hypothetical protein
MSEETYLELDDGPRLPLPVDDSVAVHHHLACAVSPECAFDFVEELQIRESD